MIKRKLKSKFIPLFVCLFVLVPFLLISTIINLAPETNVDDLDYVDEVINDNTIPVINTKKTILNPYQDPNVKIAKTYYDYQSKEEEQLNSITYYDNTYMQSNGIDYVNEEVFDVVSILEGTVINVKDDNLKGKTIEIEHNNGLISVYQSLSEVDVKKGDIINSGQVIGKSGNNELDKEIGNHLHFEIYDNSQSVDPLKYLNKEIEEN